MLFALWLVITCFVFVGAYMGGRFLQDTVARIFRPF